jgi:hypothetical protein
MPSILYLGDAHEGATALDRAHALERLGASIQLVGLDQRPESFIGRVGRRLVRRTQLGRWVRQANENLLDASASAPDIVWLDKPWMLWPSTLIELKRRGAYIVLFNNDNPWGTLERGLWRLLVAGVQHTDLVITPRNADVPSYLACGAQRIRLMDFAFEPSRQYPPTPEERAPDFEFDISFLGSPTKDGAGIRPDRPAFLAEVARRLPGKLAVFGQGWNRAMDGDLSTLKCIGPGRYGASYRRTIQASRASLSLVTWAQADETSHRAFEITACGGLLVAERSPRLEECYREGKEALFFTGVDECVAKLVAVLEGKVDRDAITCAGSQRARSAGYDNDSRLRELILATPELLHFFPHLAVQIEPCSGLDTVND